jgi:hypothetical protein
MDRHPNWRAAIGARVLCKGRAGKWTIISRRAGSPPVVKIQADAQTSPTAAATQVPPLSLGPLTVSVADLEPVWPPEPGMLVEVRADGPIGEVWRVTDVPGPVRVDVRLTDVTLSRSDHVAPLESFDSEELAAL